MVNDLSQLTRQAQISVHFLIKKCSDACCSQAKSLSSEIHSLTNSTGLEMHISVSTITVTPGSILKVADHREGHAGVTRQVLSQTKGCRYQALVPFFDFLQLCMLRPEAINPRGQVCDAVDVEIQVDEASGNEIGEQRLLCAGEKSGKLREGDGPVPAP